MAGGEYEPSDSRDVTRGAPAGTAPGKPSGWHEREDGESTRGEMEPGDSRDVTGAAPAGTEPGRATGWRDADGKEGTGDDVAKSAPPAGVPDGAPFSAADAAAALLDASATSRGSDDRHPG